MVSFHVRQTLKLTAGILIPVFVAAPQTGFSQSVFGPAATDAQRQIVERIQEEQEREGPYSVDLLDPLTALGLLYQESGDHALAIAAMERAAQVVRANYGLSSLDEAPLIRQRIRSEEARGNFAAAWDLEQDLLTLAGAHPDDLRIVPILREIGDKRMDLVNRYLAGEFPPQLYLGCFYGRSEHDIRGCTSGSKGQVVQAIVSDAQKNYAASVGVMLRNRLYSSDELRELEMELVRSSYQHGRDATGKRSLGRLLAYEVVNSEPWLSQIDALVQMADWDLLHGSNQAIEIYERAYRQLVRNGVAQGSIEQIFSPDTPVVLPTFLANPLASDETPDSIGYIDVAFDITKYGSSRQVEILGTTTNATDAAKDRLVQLVSLGRFRPRVTDGQFVRSSRVIVRYFLNDKRALLSVSEDALERLKAGRFRHTGPKADSLEARAKN